jgi:hypothetical protein
MMAASGTSLYVKILDGQEVIADFAGCKFEETEVDFDGSGNKTARFNYTIKLLQEPSTNQMLPLLGRTVIFSCSKTVSANIHHWLADGFEVLKISRKGADKNNTTYKVRGLQRSQLAANSLQTDLGSETIH